MTPEKKNVQSHLITNSPPAIEGASKRFFPTDDPNVYQMIFKDVLHGRGRVQEIVGTGRLREEFCYYFFRLLESEGIKTHIAERVGDIVLDGDSALLDKGILVRKMDMIKLELIGRLVARGNWVDDHKFPILEPGAKLDTPAAEFCLKWKEDVKNLDYDDLDPWKKWIHHIVSKTPLQDLLVPEKITRDDPRINTHMAVVIDKYAKDPRIKGHMLKSLDEARYLEDQILKVAKIYKDFLLSFGIDLEDFKYEVGIPIDYLTDYTRESHDNFYIGDELTQDSSRGANKAGESLTKDLHRKRKSPAQILDGYALFTESIKTYVK